MGRYSFGVGVYPQGEEAQQEELEAYIRQAAALGCGEVFCSLHLPERNNLELLGPLEELACLVHGLGLQLSADLSGAMARTLAQGGGFPQLRRMKLDWVRLDFGFAPADTLALVEAAAPGGVMLNASVLEPAQLAQQVSVLRGACPRLGLRGHHNYYPMPDTGLSLDFVARRGAQYRPYGIPVTACVASRHRPRPPMGMGLPTVERHRTLSPAAAALALLGTGQVDDILVGDPFATRQELEQLALVCGHGQPVLRLCCAPDSTPQERALVLDRPHQARPDEADFAIRSLSSRQMAAQGVAVPPRSGGIRRPGDVVVVNSRGKRYSGEVQLLRRIRPPADWSNLVGRIVPEDLWMLPLLGPGADFRLVCDEASPA